MPFMFQTQLISSHHKPSMYQGFPNHIVIMPLLYQPFHYNLMRNSCQPIIHNSWLASLNHTHSYQTFSTKPKTKQALPIPSQENNLTWHCLAQHLAQAGGSRSGETFSPRRDVLTQASPLRLGEGSKKAAGAHTGSRLGETPLAWTRCSLAQKAELVAWVTFRAKVLGELPVHLA